MEQRPHIFLGSEDEMNLFYFGNLLNYSGLLMVCALGAVFALRNGQMNLGGEGQVYSGGFISAVTLNFFGKIFSDAGGDQTFSGFAGALGFAGENILALAIAAVLSMAVTALFNLFCCILRLRRNAKELLTTFLLSAALIPLIDGAITGPFRAAQGNLLATAFIPERFRFAHFLLPSNLNGTFFASLVICAAGGFLLYKTVFGKRLCIFGTAGEFAVYSGFSQTRAVIVPMMISGALHGLAGFFAVTGTYYTCHVGFYAGLGWNGLSCALLSRTNPFLVIPVSLFLSLIYILADKIVLTHNFGFDVSVLLQGIVLLVTAFSLVLSGKVNVNSSALASVLQRPVLMILKKFGKAEDE